MSGAQCDRMRQPLTCIALASEPLPPALEAMVLEHALLVLCHLPPPVAVLAQLIGGGVGTAQDFPKPADLSLERRRCGGGGGWCALSLRIGAGPFRLCGLVDPEQFTGLDGISTVIGAGRRKPAVLDGPEDGGLGDACLFGGVAKAEAHCCAVSLVATRGTVRRSG